MRIDLEVLSSSARDTGSQRDAGKRQCESDRQCKNIIQLHACTCATLVAPMSLDRATGLVSGVVGRVIPLRSFCRVGEATAHSAGLYCAPHFSAATLFVQPSVLGVRICPGLEQGVRMYPGLCLRVCAGGQSMHIRCNPFVHREGQ